MSLEENKALVRREQGELWNHTGNLDAAAELFAPDRVEDAKQEAAAVRRGFPDLESTIEDLIAERDKVVAYWRAQATHRGEYMGIPPTGNRVNFRACYALGRKSHRNADSTVGSVPSRSPFPAFLSRFQSSS